jgi:uncharacterized membrane protein YdjX (TVP38/TMEM64 family)
MTGAARVAAFWAFFLALLFSAIIVPFLVFGESFERSAESASSGSVMAAAAYLGFLLALDVILPVPSSMNSTMLGTLLGVWGGTLVSTFCMTISSAIGYFIGAKLSGSEQRRWLPASEIDRVKRLSETYGTWILVIARPIPVLAEATTIVAGIGAMPLSRFFFLTGLSNLGVSLVYAFTGARSVSANSFLFAVLFACALPVVIAGAFKLISSVFHAKKTPPAS